MKKTIKVVWLSLLFYSLPSMLLAQSITLNINNKTVKEAIESLKDVSGYTFIFEVNDLDTRKVVSVSANQQPIDDVVKQILDGQDVSYTIKGKSIIVTKKQSEKSDQTKKGIVTISGKISDTNSEPLIGVSVSVKSTSLGTVTDSDGNFYLSDIPENSILSISYVGYRPREITVSKNETLNIILSEDVRMIDEVVVIGYGTLHKQSVTSAITSLKREDFMQGDISSPMSLLKGKVAGLIVNSFNSSDPTKSDGGIQMMLRGVSNLTDNQQPLIVVDGIAGASLDAISPDDIESIDILKDGSAAAIYGTRGNNGVVIVTTKKGTGNKKGKVSVDYHGYFSYETIANRIGIFTAQDFLKIPEITGGKALTAVTDLGYNTDWFKEIYQTPINQNHNLSIRSGDAISNFIASVNYLKQDGILKNSSKDQLRMRISANQSIWDNKLQFQGSVLGTIVNSSYVNPAIYYNTLLVNPTAPIKNPKTGGLYTFFQDADNPVQELNEKNTDTKWNRFALNGKIIYEPIRGLNFSAVGSIERFQHIEGTFATFNYFNGETKHGEVWRNSKFDELKTGELLANYDFTIQKVHQLTFLAGYSYQEHNWEGFDMYNYDYPTELLSYNQPQLGLALTKGDAGMGGYKARSKLISLFSRINYSLNHKYIASLSIRREGSTKFGANNKWGTFPAISLGWNASSESFMKNIDWIDNLKLRAGYGVTGAEPNSPYLSINRYAYDNNNTVYSDGSWILPVGPNSNANRNLRWETKKELNAGIDYSVLRGRISGSIDLYRRRTDDLLYTYQVPVPPNLVSNIMANVGSLTNSGIELLLSTIPVQTKNMTLNISGNFSSNKNMLNKLSNEMYQRDFLELGATGAPIQKTTHLVKEGEPIGDFYGWKSASITETGSNWLDSEGNIITMENDRREILGNGIPKIFYGFTTAITYKKIDANISLRGAGKFQILNQYRMLHETFMEGGNQNYPKTILDKPYGVDAYVYTAPSYVSYYIENGDYLKVDNITLGYTFKFSKYVDRLRFYLSGMNLHTFTKYKGIDPEINILGLSPGIDQIGNLYPSTRSFSFGIQLTLY